MSYDMCPREFVAVTLSFPRIDNHAIVCYNT